MNPTGGHEDTTDETWITELETAAVVICVSGILGNLSILAAILFQQRAMKVNCITSNLAVFNVLCGLYQTTKSFFILEKEFALHKKLCDHFSSTALPYLTGCVFNYFLITLYFYLFTFKSEIFQRLFTRTRIALLIITTWLLAIAIGVFRSQAAIDKATSSITRCYLTASKHETIAGLTCFLFIVMVILYANYRLRKSVHCWLPKNASKRGGRVRTAIDLISIHVRATVWLGATIVCIAIGSPLSTMASRALKNKIRNVFYLMVLTNQLIYPVLLLINRCRRQLRVREKRRICAGNAPPCDRPRHLAVWVVPRPQESHHDSNEV